MINKDDVFKNKSHWVNMNSLQYAQYIDLIFNYYKQQGFPYHSTDKEYRNKEFKKLQNYDRTNLIEDGIVKQTMHGLGLAWSYFPHAFDVKCNNKMTPLEVFNDDEMFMKVIEKRLKMGTFISNAGIMKMLKMFSNTQAVSNFRPTAAAAIYDKYAPNGVVWDMSGGWGGRMLGAMVSSVKHYITTEPSTLTHKGLIRLAVDYGEQSNTEIHVVRKGSEEFLTPSKYVDLCFTSPPYFNLEKYSDEDSQSYVKYDNKKAWVEGFLRDTFYNCHFSLKDNGHMLINIADPKKNDDISLEDETIRIAEQEGFEHVDTLKLALSNPNMVNRTSAFKYEPIFVFKKI